MRYMSHDFLPVHIRLRLENVLSIPVTFSIRILPVSHLIKLLSRCCLLQIVTPHKLEVTARKKYYDSELVNQGSAAATMSSSIYRTMLDCSSVSYYVRLSMGQC